MNHEIVGDPETQTRIQQYEMAFRMQASVPELTDIASEPASTFRLYGDASPQPRHLRQHRPASAAHGRTRRPLRADLPQQLGHALATSPAGCPISAAMSIKRAGASCRT